MKSSDSKKSLESGGLGKRRKTRFESEMEKASDNSNILADGIIKSPSKRKKSADF